MNIGSLAVENFDNSQKSQSGNGHGTTAMKAELGKNSANEEAFEDRHIGPSEAEITEMLLALGCQSVDEFIGKVIPVGIRSPEGVGVSASPLSERETLELLRSIAVKNKIFRSFIGMGYYGCLTPGVIQRNILENPGWYTQYTPYQAEIAQGRLEALLNFQTLVIDLTGLQIANASLLDEGTAAAEAMSMSWAKSEEKKSVFFISSQCHPQTIALVETRAQALGVKVIIGSPDQFQFSPEVFGALLQYPASDGALSPTGNISFYRQFVERAHQAGALVTVASDLLALAVLTPPGEFGADICVGSAQRFGVPLGFGGPHAAFFATSDELKRLMPGRLVGISKDSAGNPGLRLSLQTREQHIRREKATSNICTAQVLLAVMASMYAVYHGPKGIRRIAERVHRFTRALADALREAGVRVVHGQYFDTLRISLTPSVCAEALKRAEKKRINLRVIEQDSLGVSLDESTTLQDLADLFEIITGKAAPNLTSFTHVHLSLADFARKSEYLTHPVFNSFHSETEFLRYLKRLESRDLSLAVSMIPLGSCTMKLNATSEMLPVTWPEFGNIHPFAPSSQTRGYQELFRDLEKALMEVTGFAAVSLQPNSGAQGEYAGLLVIRAYHESRGQGHRKICLIPRSAHGTNPASAAMAGMEVVVVECDAQGNIDVADLTRKAKEHKERLSALMVTYPSTHGVFEESISEICRIIHRCGGQVYMDGANLNALVGLCRPSDIGADVCHINLHKTFCIPHGGGGPGMGPIGVKKHLAAFLPNHPLVDLKHKKGVGPVSAAPWGSASILTIPWVYMKAMGGGGLKRASEIAILNANYIAKQLEPHYPILYKGMNNCVAHECILDLRAFKKSCGIEVSDVAKRLMDYGFHAPTVSWPVAETLMIEPTESESKAELDRFCQAMIQIRAEVREVEEKRIDPLDNPLKNAPHTARSLVEGPWKHPYSQERAAFPISWLKQYKFWPAVGRIDNSYGDKNLVCSCLPIEAFEANRT